MSVTIKGGQAFDRVCKRVGVEDLRDCDLDKLREVYKALAAS